MTSSSRCIMVLVYLRLFIATFFLFFRRRFLENLYLENCWNITILHTAVYNEDVLNVKRFTIISNFIRERKRREEKSSYSILLKS